MTVGVAALAVAAGSYGAFDTYRDEQVRQQLSRWDLPRDLADGLGELVSVSIANYRLESLNWLSGDPQHLTLSASSLQDLQPLAGLDNLLTLSINLVASSVADLQHIATLSALATLSVSYDDKTVPNDWPPTVRELSLSLVQ